MFNQLLRTRSCQALLFFVTDALVRGTGDVVNSIKTDGGWRGHGAKLSMEAGGLVSVCCLT